MLLTAIRGDNDKVSFRGQAHQRIPHSPISFVMPTTMETVHQRTVETTETIEREKDKSDVALNGNHERPEVEDTETVLDLTVVNDAKSSSATFSYSDDHKCEGDEDDDSGPCRTSTHERNSLYFSALGRHGNGGTRHRPCEVADEQTSRHTTSFMVDDILNPNKFRGGPTCHQRPAGHHAAERRLQRDARRDSRRSMEVSGNHRFPLCHSSGNDYCSVCQVTSRALWAS